MPDPSPLRQYVSLQRSYDADMRRLLTEAALESERIVNSLGRKGSFTKTKYRQASRDLQKMILEMYGEVEDITVAGQRAAARRAANSERWFNNTLASRFGERMPQLEAAMAYSAENGIAAVLAKQANAIPLSRLVYATGVHSGGVVDQEIRKSLLLQEGHEELAKRVSGLINPNVPGGVSYAANRLARTEINNAFHRQQITSRSEEPWTEGIEWNLSGSHPKPDACNEYAESQHFKGGPVGVFRVGDVPGKPHPNCLCFVTAVTMDEDEFVDRFVRGDFNGYLDRKISEGGEASGSITIKEPFRGRRGPTNSRSAAYLSRRSTREIRDGAEVNWEIAKLRGEIGHYYGQLDTLIDQELFGNDDFAVIVKNHQVHVIGKKNTGAYIRENVSQSDAEWYVSYLRLEQKAAPSQPVKVWSQSPGHMTDEDAAILFVKTKDEIALSKGIPIKGANPVLDRETYAAISKITGYTPAEIEAKIVSYRSSGKKLSALKRSVLKNNKVYDDTVKKLSRAPKFEVPEPRPAPVQVPKTPKTLDPVPAPKVKPPVRPTVTTKNETVKVVTREIQRTVPEEEDLVKALIKAKEHLAADPSNAFTVFSAGPKFQSAIEKLISDWGMDVKFSDLEKARLSYVAKGKKVSALKKQMQRNGELEITPKIKLDTAKATAQTEFERDLERAGIELGSQEVNLELYDLEEMVTGVGNGPGLNPLYDPWDPKRLYSVNCTHVVTSYEMRRRGYRVFANKRLGGQGRYESDWLGDRWATAAGERARLTPLRDGFNGYQDILKITDTQEDGWRGIIRVTWKRGGGHVFNAEKINGKVHFFDAQIGEAFGDASIERLFDEKIATTSFVRMDNLVPNSKVLELVSKFVGH